MFQKILLMLALEIKCTPVTVRVTMETTKCLLTLTWHIAKHKLLLTPSKLTQGHQGKDFKGKHD